MKVVIDFETTGLNPETDEILSVSIIDENYNVLLNTLCKPFYLESWETAQAIHGISPADVEDCYYFSVYAGRIIDILEKADGVIAYNCPFEKAFLKYNGINVKKINWIDPMIMFAEIYGEWSSARKSYKWQKLSICADYYGYKFKAHNSLEDVKATLYCYKKMIGK